MSVLFKDSEVDFDGMPILELRKTLLWKVVDTFTIMQESSLDWHAKKRARQRCINIAAVVRRGSEDVVRELCRYIVNDPDNIDSFIEEKLGDIIPSEPIDMDTIERMNRVLGTIIDRYETYVTTGDLDPLSDKLTLKQLVSITLGLDKNDDVELEVLDALVITFRSIMFTDETLMFHGAPKIVSEKFLVGGVKTIAKIGAPAKLKEEVNTVVDNMITKEDNK